MPFLNTYLGLDSLSNVRSRMDEFEDKLVKLREEVDDLHKELDYLRRDVISKREG